MGKQAVTVNFNKIKNLSNDLVKLKEVFAKF